MQGDGNLVLTLDGRPYWQSGTAGHPGAYAVLQRDGNVVVYDAAGRTPLWQSATSVPSGHEMLLVLEGGGWLVLFDDTANFSSVVVEGRYCGC
ncbi:hypothetical protein [Cellulomonas marina]|uniref:D-mannose binding lectin n=1 Tax=Cellulomonas marina TaxID=988821 RepID=A0A1I1A8Y6_9CELL|nr:hypothetical protein [Cellulomonas marina]GIG29551.1 hypothetical protein Cma02nite_21510 [Cellulomonas marina]SFB32930.1 D-mannose binding lectin [Cellulomonas marina]